MYNLFKKYNVRFSDVALLLFPLIVGIGLVSIFVRKESICGKRPKLQPPGWVFGLVWPILYILMGISIFTYWRKTERKMTWPFYLFIFGVILLQVWWIVFNKICAEKAAFGSLVAIALYFLGVTLSFYKVSRSRVATLCLIPLLIWLSFASYLTYKTI
jgi:tryptophan-rich sensory protein